MSPTRQPLEGEWRDEPIVYHPDRLMVWFREDLEEDAEALNRAVDAFEHQYTAELVIGPVPGGLALFVLRGEDLEARDSLAIAHEIVGSDDGVAGAIHDAHPDCPMEWAAWPDDPDLALQWAIQQVDLPKAWARTTGSQEVVIGIVDSGIPIDQNGKLTHPELDDPARYKYGLARKDLNYPLYPTHSDWTTYPTATYPNDTEDHGTMVTGVAAAESNNNTQIAGVNWNSEVYVTKVKKDASYVSFAILELSDWAYQTGRKLVINISVVGCAGSAVYSACKKAIDRGAIIVAAAGNKDECVNCGVCIPAKHSLDGAMKGALVAVGATELKVTSSGAMQEVVAQFSRTGPHITVVAPGGGILGLAAAGGTINDGGTSYAAPLVAGILSLVWSVNPSLTNTQVVKCLKDTAWVPSGVNVPDVSWGYGRVNAGAAVACAAPPLLAIDPGLFDSEWEKALMAARLVKWVVPKIGPELAIEYEAPDLRALVELLGLDDPVD